ncbi:MAG: tetratricopeptide repeat protein [Lysobacteraceae bacterium]
MDMDEHEQGELVRTWLRQNGGAIITGIAVGLAGIFGYQWWQQSQTNKRLDAAANYQTLVDAVERDDVEAAGQIANGIAERVGNAPYAGLAALRVAGERAGKNEAAALADLSKAATMKDAPAIVALAKLRQARLELSAGKPDAALALLAAIPADHYGGLVAEVRGDALLAQGKTAEAGEAYRDALTELATGAPNRFLVEMKLADLGIVTDEAGV